MKVSNRKNVAGKKGITQEKFKIKNVRERLP